MMTCWCLLCWRFAGKMYPLEAHLVSVVPQSELASCPATGCLVVTAVLYELADDLDTDNPWLKTFFDKMPYKEDASIKQQRCC